MFVEICTQAWEKVNQLCAYAALNLLDDPDHAAIRFLLMPDSSGWLGISVSI